MSKLISAMPKIYPGWQDTKAFVRDTKQYIDYASSHRTNSFVQHDAGVDGALRVLESISERFGQYQNAEWQELKEVFIANEMRESGGVRLQDFYRIGLEGNFLFRESLECPRALGALDESNAREPRVIVPNFVLSKSNCLASTSVCTVCCIN